MTLVVICHVESECQVDINPGFWRSSIGVVFCLESIYEVEDAEILHPEANIEKQVLKKTVLTISCYVPLVFFVGELPDSCPVRHVSAMNSALSSSDP